MTELTLNSLSVERDGESLVDRVSFAVRPGELTVLLGPNGAGKSLTLRAALGLIPRSGGEALLDGQDMARMPAIERARRLAYLPQVRPLAWPSRVRDVIALGRYAFGGAPGRLSPEDAAAVTSAMEACGLTGLAERKADTLSGGELARMHCARAFAARTPLLVADEPVAALDPRHQFAIMDLIRDYVAEGGGALVVLHDINLAARYADRLIWMKSGRIEADGSPKDTLTEARLAKIYGVRARMDGAGVRLDGAL